jgi:hypothetical protein
LKLFHCIVVMGAAIGSGCGSEETAAPSGAPDAPSDDPAVPAAEGGCPGDGAGLSLSTSGCFSTDPCGSAQAPLRPEDCAKPQQLICDPSDSCRCDLGAPEVATDCPFTAQFDCADWLQPCGCQCDADAAVDPSACGCDAGTANDAAVLCPFGQWYCHTYDPPVGCECSRPIAVAIL